jgi:hypothetical protein
MSPADAAGLAWVLGVGGGLASIAVTAWSVFVIVDGFRRRQQLRAATELQARLLDRIGSAQEFAAFLATDAGARFLDAIAVDRRVAHAGILRALQSGIVALILGLALLLLGHRILASTGAAALGTVAAALGVGLLVASAVSYVAARSMGLLTTTTRAGDRILRP